MKPYHDLVQKIINNGIEKEDRTGTGTLSIFGHQMRFDLSEGFPLLTTKKIFTKSVIVELLWFLRGDTNVEFLHEHGVHIWDSWADENGELGPVYGSQWRTWTGSDGMAIDQIENVINQINENPFSRRLIVTAWNPDEINDMALPPCHTMFQFNVRPDNIGQPAFLDCHLYQRSGDVFLGVPFNIASYALLTYLIARQTGLIPGEFVHTLGDAHLYKNHISQAKLLLSRDIRPAPSLLIRYAGQSINDYVLDDFQFVGYNPHPAILAPISV